MDLCEVLGINGCFVVLIACVDINLSVSFWEDLLVMGEVGLPDKLICYTLCLKKTTLM